MFWKFGKKEVSLGMNISTKISYLFISPKEVVSAFFVEMFITIFAGESFYLPKNEVV